MSEPTDAEIRESGGMVDAADLKPADKNHPGSNPGSRIGLERAYELIKKYGNDDEFRDDELVNWAKGIVEGALSERQRMIEKFRPVVEALKKAHSYFGDSALCDSNSTDRDLWESLELALALWKEIEKESHD